MGSPSQTLPSAEFAAHGFETPRCYICRLARLTMVEERIYTDELPERTLKRITRPVPVFKVAGFG